jgi:hypothetical protein
VSNENKLIRDSGRALRAQQLLDDELLVEAFKTLEDAYTTGWRNTNVSEAPAREKLFLAVNIVGKVRDHLTAVVNNGKLAAAELREITAAAERKKRFGIL